MASQIFHFVIIEVSNIIQLISFYQRQCHFPANLQKNDILLFMRGRIYQYIYINHVLVLRNLDIKLKKKEKKVDLYK